MTLFELIVAVKEKNLPKEKIEGYYDDLSSLFAQLQFEMADLEKLEALFSDDYPTAIARKNAWKKTPEGQRLIVLKRYTIATKEILTSLKSRLFRLY